MNTTTLMLSSEGPKVSLAKRRPIFTPEQIEQTLAVATEPYRTLFTVAALTGARISERRSFAWTEIRLDDLDDAEIAVAWQVDRMGNRRPNKDRRIGPDGADPTGAGVDPGATQARVAAYCS